jgi:hypothetical protein
MGKVKYFFKNITLLNTVLLSIITIMVQYYVLPFFYADMKYTLPAEKKAAGAEEITHAELSPPSPEDYEIIGEENLFHPERRIPPEKKVEPELPKPDFVLYGTMVSDDISLAFLEDLKAPRTTPGRGKRQVSVKKGDLFSGFTVKEIEHEKIVMVRGEEKVTVSIVDHQKPKKRESVTTAGQQAPAQTPQKSQKATPAPAQPQKQPAASRPVAKPATPAQSTGGFSDVDERMRQLFQK